VINYIFIQDQNMLLLVKELMNILKIKMYMMN
jgi:hypothetical protein